MRNIIIDTDGNTEAMAALEMALQDPEVNIQAVTTVAAGLTAEEAASNVLTTLQDRNIEVCTGMEKPMVDGGQKRRKLSTHVLLSRRLVRNDNTRSAVDALIRLVGEGESELITMGPLTNVAMAFVKNRDAMLKVRKITMLAGMIFHGDVGPMTEYNIYMDPCAADLIFKTGVPITILPIEVGSYATRMQYALHPEKITKQYDSYTRIELAGEYTFGANINDVRDRSRQEFVAQHNVMYPFNCKLVADNSTEKITMEA